jgi:ribonuclease HI
MRGEFRQKSNLDLWKRLNDLVAPYAAGRLTWTHVRGHNGHPVQERADALAVGAARARSTNMQ